MKKILVCAYRDWALKSPRTWDLLNHGYDLYLAQTEFDANNMMDVNNFEFVLLLGWSWIIPKHLCEKHNIFAVHPSNLPEYAGGSPIQHQILDGLTETKLSMFKVTSEIDSGDIILQVDLSLNGNVKNIFDALSDANEELIYQFKKQYPNFENVKSNNVTSRKKRLKPEHSVLSKEQLNNMTAIELYNFIRCKTDPYPNACIQDETGTLYFKDVTFKK